MLQAAFGLDLTHGILETFQDLLNAYSIGSWKLSGLDAGHFVEAVRRAIEFELFAISASTSAPVSRFTEQVLKNYEGVVGKDESLRILIPRVLYSMYTIRNKRGVGHQGVVSPNAMDASLVIHSAKWVLAELVRLKSNLQPGQTQQLVDSITQRELPVVWKTGHIIRVLNPRIKTRDQVLLLLLSEGSMHEKELLSVTEYVHATRFRSLLVELHKERLIEYDKGTGNCQLSPTGVLAAGAVELENRGGSF